MTSDANFFSPDTPAQTSLRLGDPAGAPPCDVGFSAVQRPLAVLDPSTVRDHHVERCDAVDFLRKLPDASVDLVVTDPAYESLEKHRAIGTTTRLKHSKSSSNDWFTIFPNARFPELFAEAHRVLKKNSHLYLFCDAETMFVAKPLAEEAGFKFWKPLVWDKCSIGMGYHYRARYEFVLFFEKGKRKLKDLGIADIITHARIRGGYPSEKPSAVAEVLVKQSSDAGDLVVDPFCGSGSVGVAARTLGRRFAGSDICEEAVETTIERLTAPREQDGVEAGEE
ncbi:MAG: site-specific DNA-methyltransferase [Polyangiaceae bacterium]|nr:site-specific DNA-methyltransferase [Polyangiaceae bacterium]